MDAEQTVESFGPVPLAVTKWLVVWTRSFPHPPGSADWDDGDVKLWREIDDTMETLPGDNG